MQVELPVSKIKVELVDKIGWGHREKIKAAMMGKIGISTKDTDNASISGDGLFRGKLRAMEVCILKMTDEAGTEIPFNEAWLDQLDQEDGNLLYDTIDSLANVEKK